jgi:hypothetical protein
LRPTNQTMAMDINEIARANGLTEVL